MPPTSLSLSSRLRRCVVVPTVSALAAGLVLAGTTHPAYALVVPKAPVTLPAAIESMPPYQPQTYCDPVNKPGVVAFAKLLTATYRDTSIVSISRSCTAGGTSEHYQGRALDWGAYYKNPTQVKEVQAVFAWLFATDAHGNKNAMLRRLGIMYVIWNQQIWGAWSQKWEPYACSGETACHQNHVHFSFDWSGALKKTSFWTGRVSSPLPTPNYVYTSTAFGQRMTVSAARLSVSTPFWLKAGDRYTFTVKGTYHYDATTGHLADANCRTTSASAPWVVTAASLWVGTHHTWRPVTATGGGCNTATHAYWTSVVPTTTGPMQLAIHNPSVTGRSGSLTVTVQRVA